MDIENNENNKTDKSKTIETNDNILYIIQADKDSVIFSDEDFQNVMNSNVNISGGAAFISPPH